MKVGFVFTNYNNSEVTIEAIKSLNNNILSNDLKIVIVDNNSTVNEKNKLIKFTANLIYVHVTFNKENIGYFKGINCGLDFLRQNRDEFDFIIIGNNDLIFPDNFIASLIDDKSKLMNYPVLSPNIITMDGIHQNPHVINKINKTREIIYDLYHANYYLSILIKKFAFLSRKFTDRNDEEQHNKEQFIYQGYGACYILTPKFFHLFESLWAPTFLLGEEYFLSRQLEDKGFKVLYVPTIVVKHNCHVSTSKVPSKTMWKYSVAAHKVYRKFVKIF